ncbi:MAG: hypothetical protein Q4D04_06425, partial [Clostridia bacterium]|nr:hypothetical protein [Clostridia bacterium]
MKKTLSMILASILILACAASFAEPVTLLLMTGSESDPYWKCIFEQIADFNEAYEGRIRIETEFAGSQSADRLEKMKVLNASGQLPAVITQMHEDVGFAQTLAANGRLMDLKPYYDADPEWQKYAMDN